MQLNPAEISELIRKRIESFQVVTEARTEGTVVSLTDGIARIHGLSDVMYGEMIEFPGNTFSMALNLERDSVGAVVLVVVPLPAVVSVAPGAGATVVVGAVVVVVVVGTGKSFAGRGSISASMKSGPVTTVIIDRREARNAVTPEMAQQLADAFIAFDADDEARVGVFYGAHGTFCAGFDLGGQCRQFVE